MNLVGRVFSSLAAVAFTLVFSATPSLAGRDEIGQGVVQLGACQGAVARYVAITRAEDAELLGLGFGEEAASLANTGVGQSGVAFTPDYSKLTPEEKSQIRFAVANVFIKGDAQSKSRARVSICFGDEIKTLPLTNFRTSEAHLGWLEYHIVPRKFGLDDDDAPRLDRISISLSGEGQLLVGNTVTYWEIPVRGRDPIFGRNFYATLETKLEDCSILNDCK